MTDAPSGLVTGMGTGVREGTRDRVARSVMANGPSSAADLADRLDLTPAAVRRHLDQLVSEGVLEPRTGRAKRRGRPARLYAVTDTGRDRFEQQYDALAVDALRFLAETGGQDAVRAFADRRVAFIERDYATVAAAEPDLTPAEVLARVLSDEGYAAAVRSLPLAEGGHDSGAEQLCQQHCPVAHVAHEFPELCHAETEAISRVLGRHVQRLATIAHGDGVCTTCIPAATTPHTSRTAPQRKAAR